MSSTVSTAQPTTASMAVLHGFYYVHQMESQSDAFILTLFVIRCILVMLSVPGNILVITTTLMCKKLRTDTNLITIQIAAISLLQTTVNVTHSTYVMDSDMLQSVPLCVFMAQLLLVEIIISLLTFAMVAVNRYVLIAKGKSTYKRIFSKRNIVLMISVCWVWAGLLSSLPHVGYGQYGYNNNLTACAYVITDLVAYSFVVVVASLSLMPSLFVTTISYARIVFMFLEIRKKVEGMNKGTTIQNKNKRRMDTLRTVSGLIVMFLIYSAGWVPFGLMAVGDIRGQWSPILYGVAGHTVWMQNILFPILYVAMSKSHRQAHFLAIQCKWKELKDF